MQPNVNKIDIFQRIQNLKKLNETPIYIYKHGVALSDPPPKKNTCKSKIFIKIMAHKLDPYLPSAPNPNTGTKEQY